MAEDQPLIFVDAQQVWRVTAFIGEGAFGQVHRVIRNGRTGRDHEGAAKVAKDSGDLRNELEIYQRIANRSNFLPSLWDHGIDDQSEFIILSLEGMDLDRVYETAPNHYIPPGDLYYFAYNGFKALESLHTFDIVHRDIKPNNVVYGITSGKAELVLIDLGYAQFVPTVEGVRIYPPSDDMLFRHRWGSIRMMEHGAHTELDDVHMMLYTILDIALVFDPYVPFAERLQRKREIMENPERALTHLQQFFVPLITAVSNLNYASLPNYASIFAAIEVMGNIINADEEYMWI